MLRSKLSGGPTMQQQISSPREKLILLLLSAIQFSHVMDFMVMMPLGPQLMRVFNISASEFGYIVSSYGISSGIAGLLVSPFIDKYDRKLFLNICLAGLLAGTLLCAVAESASVLMIARVIAGFFGGVLGGLVNAIISDIFPPERRGYAISRVMLSFSISSIIGVPAGLALANSFGWHMPFFVVSFLLVMLLVLAHFRFPNLTSHIEKSTTIRSRIFQIGHLLIEKPALIGFFTTVFIIVGQFMVIPYISPYLVKNLSFSEQQLPLLYLFGGAASIFTMPLVGKATDKFGVEKVFPIGVLISIIPMFTLTHLTTQNPVLILSTTTLFMVCMGARMVPYSSLLTTVVEPKKRGAYLSLNASVQSLAQGSAALLAASLISENAEKQLVGYTTSGWIAAVFSLITIALGFQIAKSAARSAQAERVKASPQSAQESADPS